MWCIGKIDQQYRTRMYDLLALYAQPVSAEEPVICIDEKSKQILKDSRAPLPALPGRFARQDYEYERMGTCNLFVAVEPKCGQRTVVVTDRRTKVDFVIFAQYIIDEVYRSAKRIHVVLDNLNTHFRSCFEEVLGMAEAQTLLQRVEFHYTPKHASWLNMAEIEIGVLDRQCLDRRLPDRDCIVKEVAAWQHQRNVEEKTIKWTFTKQKADEKMAKHYVT